MTCSRRTRTVRRPTSPRQPPAQPRLRHPHPTPAPLVTAPPHPHRPSSPKRSDPQRSTSENSLASPKSESCPAPRVPLLEHPERSLPPLHEPSRQKSSFRSLLDHLCPHHFLSFHFTNPTPPQTLSLPDTHPQPPKEGKNYSFASHARFPSPFLVLSVSPIPCCFSSSRGLGGRKTT